MLAEGFWEVDGHPVSPLDLSHTLPVGGGLLVLCSLPGPPVLKNTCANGYYSAWPGWEEELERVGEIAEGD